MLVIFLRSPALPSGAEALQPNLAEVWVISLRKEESYSNFGRSLVRRSGGSVKPMASRDIASGVAGYGLNILFNKLIEVKIVNSFLNLQFNF